MSVKIVHYIVSG